MITSESESAFWNQADIVSYFASKEPDPRVIDRMGALGLGARATGLDLGCGGGRHTQAMAEAGFLTTAIDINPAMLANTTARTRHLSEKVVLGFGSINGIPAADDIFDLVVSTGVLHQARDVDEMDRAIGEVARVGKKGGVFIGNLFVSDVWDDTYDIPDPSRPEFVETQQHVGMTLVDTGRAIEMFEQNGFSFEVDPTMDFKQENTGPRGVLRFAVELTR